GEGGCDGEQQGGDGGRSGQDPPEPLGVSAVGATCRGFAPLARCSGGASMPAARAICRMCSREEPVIAAICTRGMSSLTAAAMASRTRARAALRLPAGARFSARTAARSSCSAGVMWLILSHRDVANYPNQVLGQLSGLKFGQLLALGWPCCCTRREA